MPGLYLNEKITRTSVRVIFSFYSEVPLKYCARCADDVSCICLNMTSASALVDGVFFDAAI